EPHGLTFQLKQYGTNFLLPPRLDTQLVDANEKFWAGVVRDDLPPLVATLKFNTPQTPPTTRQKLFAKFRLPLDPNFTATYIADCYSRSLNYWGARLQAQNVLEQAGKFFDLAVQTKPDNVVAQINLDANRKLQAGQIPTVEATRNLENKF